MTSTSSLSTVVTTTTATNAVVAVVPPMDAITNKAAEKKINNKYNNHNKLAKRTSWDAPELIEDPMNGSNAKNTKKKAPKAKSAPRLRLGCGQDCVNRETRYTCDSQCAHVATITKSTAPIPTQPKVKVQLTENRVFILTTRRVRGRLYRRIHG